MKRDSLKKGGDSMYLRRKASPNYKTIFSDGYRWIMKKISENMPKV